MTPNNDKEKRAPKLSKQRQAKIERQAQLLKEILRASKALGGHGRLDLREAAK